MKQIFLLILILSSFFLSSCVEIPEKTWIEPIFIEDNLKNIWDVEKILDTWISENDDWIQKNEDKNTETNTWTAILNSQSWSDLWTWKILDNESNLDLWENLYDEVKTSTWTGENNLDIEAWTWNSLGAETWSVENTWTGSEK